MKRLKEIWLRIPRPCRVLVNLILIAALAATFYVCIGTPTLTDEQAFRQEERANLLGPSTILFHEHVENYSYGKMILAETDQGIITWVDDSRFGFNYHEKTGDLTLVAAPKWWFDFGLENWEVHLPVFLLDDHPEAIRAEVSLDIQGLYIHNLNGENRKEVLNHHFDLSAQRTGEGFFYLPLILPAKESTYASHGAEGYALDILSQTFTNRWNTIAPQSNASITALVRLYDEQGDLVAERELTIRSAS